MFQFYGPPFDSILSLSSIFYIQIFLLLVGTVISHPSESL